MAAYVIVSATFNNIEQAYPYFRKSNALIYKYGGEILSKTSDITVLNGRYDYQRAVILRFPTKEDVLACFNSDEYRSVVRLCPADAIVNQILVPDYTGE